MHSILVKDIKCEINSIQCMWGSRNERVEVLYVSKISYQFKIDCYIDKMFCVSLMATTEKKPIIDTQKIKRKALKHTYYKKIN